MYRSLFNTITDQELPFNEDFDKQYASFGSAETDVYKVKEFYDAWQSFSTSITFDYLNKFDIRMAPNRRVVRLMQKENDKIKQEAKKVRNSQVQVN